MADVQYDANGVMVAGVPFPIFMLKARLDQLTEFLLPDGCADRTKFEEAWEEFAKPVIEGVEAEVMKQQLLGTPSGLIVPGA